jgi:hypothetical protein
MPSHRLKGFIRYKALEEGIPVYLVGEAYTSKTCHRCGSLNTLVEKRLFRCRGCGLEYNRDLNAAVNIANRSFGYILGDRGSCDAPEPPLCKWGAGRPCALVSADSVRRGKPPKGVLQMRRTSLYLYDLYLLWVGDAQSPLLGQP